jgi:hypothetical protein
MEEVSQPKSNYLTPQRETVMRRNHVSKLGSVEDNKRV